MGLSKEQKLLVALFKHLKMLENLIIATMLTIQEPEQINQLMDYIIEEYDKGEELKPEKIVKKAFEIGQTEET